MWARRLERLNELLQQEISRLILTLDNTDIGFVTVTGVKLTDDLYQARVFYSVLGSEEDKEKSREALIKAIPFIRSEIRHLENLRRIPNLEFVYDETPARAARVFEILNRIETENAPPVVPPSKPRRAKTNVRKAKSSKKK
ncbi:MAG TPA: 30S ribosome-binding factor RbfA [Elusimicrobiota bacterium]|nr:30S ribosome-binding factor RbfA [Elusimicrobiota bacterium]